MPQLGIPRTLFYWRGLSWGAAHTSSTCPRLFFENPVGFGGLMGVVAAERIGSGSPSQLARKTTGLCGECYMTRMVMYNDYRRHVSNRELDLLVRGMSRERAAAAGA